MLYTPCCHMLSERHWLSSVLLIQRSGGGNGNKVYVMLCHDAVATKMGSAPPLDGAEMGTAMPSTCGAASS